MVSSWRVVAEVGLTTSSIVEGKREGEDMKGQGGWVNVWVWIIPLICETVFGCWHL